MRPTLAALTIALLLAATGCASTTPEPAGTTEAISPSESTSPTVAPLVAEDPITLEGADAEAAFLVEVRDRLSKIRSQIPNATDEQLLSAAYESCTRLANGESGEHMSLIEGESLTNGYYMDSGAVIIAARLTICPIEQ